MDQQLADAAAYALGRRCVCTHQVAALFSAWNDVMTAVLKLWRRMKNPTPTVDVRVTWRTIILAKFHPDLIWNDEALGFLKRSPQQQQQDE